ncbi:hypothetical protein M885DRAFT_140194 [Pelagophyceae sp. CCMP2097]|nr:hypothetical protein M885DRAFT_140194 [Pelagophyceae sp. CCMP2097]
MARRHRRRPLKTAFSNGPLKRPSQTALSNGPLNVGRESPSRAPKSPSRQSFQGSPTRRPKATRRLGDDSGRTGGLATVRMGLSSRCRLVWSLKSLRQKSWRRPSPKTARRSPLQRASIQTRRPLQRTLPS